MGKPSGSGWRGRWEGGSGWGTHVNPCVSFQCMTKSTTKKKKKRIGGGKKNR